MSAKLKLVLQTVFAAVTTVTLFVLVDIRKIFVEYDKSAYKIFLNELIYSMNIND